MADDEFNNWDEKFADIDQKVNQLVRKTAFDAQGIAQEESRVDQGAMKNGWYVRTEDSSNRTEPKPSGDGFLFPEVPATSHNEAWLVGGISYTIWNELGTSRMPAKPMAAPAINRVRQPFLDALARVSNGGS